MDNKRKLKLVFDFIAEYLSEENEETLVNHKSEDVLESMSEESNKEDEVTITEDEDPLKRAYSIMKKVEGWDNESARIKKAVSEGVRPYKEKLNELMEKHSVNHIDDVVNSFKEKTGITLDASGKIAEVSVKPLKSYVKISDIIEGAENISDRTKKMMKDLHNEKTTKDLRSVANNKN